MQILQGANTDSAGDTGFDALHRCRRALHRGDARNVLRHCGAPDLVPVDAGAGIAVRGVDHHGDVTGEYPVDDGPLPLRHVLAGLLVHLLAFDSVAPQHICGALGRKNREAEICQSLHREDQ